jgi:2-phospho-L-lactate guanylyltransferase
MAGAPSFLNTLDAFAILCLDGFSDDEEFIMKLTALIPVKSQGNKSRLSEMLTLDQRQRLTEWMLMRTLNTVNRMSQVESIKLIGQGASFESIAVAAGVEFVTEAEPTLNGALQAEVDRLHRQKHPCLILFTDLPLIDIASLTEFLEHGMREDTQLTLAPDAEKQGTNVLLYRGDSPLKMMYGINSFENYLTQAEKLNLNANIVQLDALAHDLDTPIDWQRWQSHVIESGFLLEAAVGTRSR